MGHKDGAIDSSMEILFFNIVLLDIAMYIPIHHFISPIDTVLYHVPVKVVHNHAFSVYQSTQTDSVCTSVESLVPFKGMKMIRHIGN